MALVAVALVVFGAVPAFTRLMRKDVFPEPIAASALDEVSSETLARYDFGPAEQWGITQESEARTHAKYPAWAQTLERLGFEGGADFSWRDGEICLNVKVYRFASSDGGDRFHRWASRFNDGFAIERFTVPGVEGSVGHRISWASGAVTEQVSFGHSRNRILVSYSSPAGPTYYSRRLITEAATSIDSYLEG